MTTQRPGADTGRGHAPPFRRGLPAFRLALIGLLAAGTLPALGQATAFDYAPGRCVIRAGVLSIELTNGSIQANQNRGGANFIVNPGIMEALRRASFRPLHWDIVNPRGTTDDAGAYAPEGSRAYWDVILRANQHTDLRGYNVLYLCSPDLNGTVAQRILTSLQVDSLLEAVNDGAVLWIDSANPTVTGAGGGGTPWETAPFFFSLTDDTLTVTGPAASNLALVTRPFRLTATQVNAIGVAAQVDRFSVGSNLVYLQPVLLSGGNVVAAAGRFGSGGFVVTGGNVGAEITGWAGQADPSATQAPDVMFAYNLMAWATGWTQSRVSARGAGASLGEVRPDLDVRWQSSLIGPVASSPVIDDVGREFVACYGANPALYCFDSNPPQDIDGDGNADDYDANPPPPGQRISDGVGDYRGGDGADLIWAIPLDGTPRSTSPATAVLAAGGTATDVVLLSMTGSNRNDRKVVCYNAATGRTIWTHVIARYQDGPRQGDVASISTPVVHNGYVYVLVSEWATDNDPNSTYGRVHCFDLATGADTNNGFWWEYPDPTLAPALPAATQYWMALPPVDDPTWVADPNRSELPPRPTPTPAVGSGPRYLGTVPNSASPTFDPHLNAVIYFGTPVAKDGSGATVQTRGCDFALVPTPLRLRGNQPPVLPSPDPFLGNRRHYRLRLRQLWPGTATVNGVWTYYAPGAGGPGSSYLPDVSTFVDTTTQFIEYPPRDVDAFLAAIPNGTPQTAYVRVQMGCPALIFTNYTDGAYTGEFEQRAFLPGSVLYRRDYPDGVSPASGRSVSGTLVAAAATTGGLLALDPTTAEPRWAYDPGSALQWTGPGTAGAQAAAADAGTAIAGAASQLINANEGYRGMAFALDPRPDVTVRVGAPISRGTAVAVQMASGGGALDAIAPTCYQLDYENGRLTFPAATANSVKSPTGVDLGPVYGRMLVINGEVYAAPDLARWEYASGTNGTIRLKHHPVRWSGTGVTPPTARLANGLPVSGFTPGEALVTVGGFEWLPTGLINCDGAVTYRTIPGPTQVNEVPVQRGAEILFRYEGMTPDGRLDVPNAYEPWERHQVPYAFGRPLAPPAAGNDGQTVVAGTESFSLNSTAPAQPLTASPNVGAYYWDYAAATPGPAFVGDPTRTLMAFAWDKVTGAVRGQLARAVYEPPQPAATPRVPLVSSSPAMDGDTVHVGSRIVNTLPTVPTYGGAATDGYLSALTPKRTLIADGERIVETVGSRVDWVCTGPRTLDPSWYNADAQANAAWPSNVPTWRVPFSRPAKAVRLSWEDFLTHGTTFTVASYPRESGLGPGDVLVVDTGNNRVVEVDRKGRQVWPLRGWLVAGSASQRTRRPEDGLGFDYYTYPANNNLGLLQPTDAYRYWRRNGATWEMHTVIADSGHFRVIDVNTTFSFTAPFQANQSHWVTTLTPTHITTPASPRPGERVQVAYTRAQPLFDPGNGAVVGYLCAANNLHELLVIEAGTRRVNPPAADALPGGTAGATWAMWSWLYDRNLDADASTDERLIFENIRDVSVSPLIRDVDGVTYLFLTVVCGRYRGPLASPYSVTVNGQQAGPICLEFRLGYNAGTTTPGLDPTNRATWVLYPPGGAAANWYQPWWSYCDVDYRYSPLGQYRLPYVPNPPNPAPPVEPKPFQPVSCQRLSYGRHLIANYFGFIENLTHANLPTATDFGTPPSLASDVFEVETRYVNAAQVHLVDPHQAIPDPWGEEWADPINQPSFAHRCQDSLGPARP